MRLVLNSPRPARLARPAATLDFHRSLPGYAQTPLLDAPALAAELGLERLAVKDESNRFGLPAFKYLGASWAIAQLLDGPAGARGVERLTTATDGNHGRAVARIARQRGLAATVYVPAVMTAPRRAAIAAEGAEVVAVEGGYDDAVAASIADAAADPRCRAANDADPDGSSPVAAWVIDGYCTLFAEAEEQAGSGFDLVMLQTGVGAFAASGVRFAARWGAQAMAVDPAGAPCVAASLEAGRPVAIKTTATTMAGLDAGSPSLAAWPALRDGLRAAVVVSDAEAADAVGRLAGLGIPAGESGAAGLAGLVALRTDAACAPLRRPRQRALVVVTEGPTA